MDAVVIFLCLFLPLTLLETLGAGRDVLLFQRRTRMRRSLTLLAMSGGLLAMLVVGMPLPLALALVIAGPAASVTGDWIGSGDWIVLQHRLRHLGH